MSSLRVVDLTVFRYNGWVSKNGFKTSGSGTSLVYSRFVAIMYFVLEWKKKLCFKEALMSHLASMSASSLRLAPNAVIELIVRPPHT